MASFQSALEVVTGKSGARLPFDPEAEWGTRDRYFLTGTINGWKFRGELREDEGAWWLPIGAAVLRDCGFAVGDSLTIELNLEGPKLPPELEQALDEAPEARRFFENQPTFYRNNFVRWIESAKQTATRERRVAEVVQLCRDGKRER